MAAAFSPVGQPDEAIWLVGVAYQNRLVQLMEGLSRPLEELDPPLDELLLVSGLAHPGPGSVVVRRKRFLHDQSPFL